MNHFFHFASELHGGAGLSALMLHRVLLLQGVESHLIYGSGSSSVPKLEKFSPSGSTLRRYGDRVSDGWIWSDGEWLFIEKTEKFDVLCGSSNIFRFDVAEKN